jgi:hypothetical protein
MKRLNLDLGGGYVSKNTAMLTIALQTVVNVALFHKQGQILGGVIKDQEQRISIYRETNEFLMERADGATLEELDKKLDYWRVIRGVEMPKRD